MADFLKKFFLWSPGALFGFAGALLLCFAPELAQLGARGNSEAKIFYLDKLLFLGRTGIAWGWVWYWGVVRFRKGVSLQQILVETALLTGAVLCIDTFLFREYWNDTLALAVWLKESSWSSLLLPGGSNPYCQSAPPGFIVTSKLLGGVSGYNRFVLGIPVLLFALGALWKFRELTAKLLAPAGAVSALWLFALNPGLWFYAGEFKQYTADIFFTTAVLASAVDFVRSPEKKWYSLAAVGVTGLFFSHALFFVLPAVGTGLLVRFRDVTFRRKTIPVGVIWFAATAAAAFYARAMMPLGMYVHEHHIMGFAPLPVSMENIKWYWNSLIDIFTAPWSLNWKIPVFCIFPAVLMVMGAVKFFKTQKNLFISGVVVMSLLLLASVLHCYSFAAGLPFAKGRLILFTIPFALLFWGKGIESKRTLWLALPALAGCLLNCLTAFMPIGNFRPAVEELVKRTPAGTPVYVNSFTAGCAVQLYAPENHFGKILLFDPADPVKALPEKDPCHLLTVDLPPQKLKFSSGVKVTGRKEFTFSEILTVEKFSSATRVLPAGGTCNGSPENGANRQKKK